MKDQLDEYLIEQEMLRHDTYGGTPSGCGPASFGPAEAADPERATSETTVDGEGKVGLSLPFDSDRTSGRPKSGVPNLKLAEVGMKFGTSEKWTQIHDNETGNTT